MLRKISYLLIAPVILFSCGGGEAVATDNDTDTTTQEVVEVVEDDTPKPPKSPRLNASGIAGGVQVDVDYGSPYVKGRTIWGDLVPYDKIWRAGANDATAITFGSDAKVKGMDIAAGTYALFITPSADTFWSVTLNEEWSKEIHGVWGAYDHNPEKDVMTMEVMVEFGEEIVESLTFSVTETGVTFAWEKASFSFEITAQ
jgi:hypothetical protein